jgi:hypothetical protein
MLKNLWSRLKHVLKPQVILPTLLAAALLIFAFSLGDVGKVIGSLRRLPLRVLGIALGCAAIYLGCKAVQLRLMLKRVGVRIPLRPFWLAFAVGETTVTLPLGLFSQNWVLSASRRVHVGRSSSATVMMLLVETAAVFLFLAVVGVPNWGIVRWAAVGILVAFVLVVAGVLFYEDKARDFAGRPHHKWIAQGAKSGVELIDGLRKLCTPATIAYSLVLAAIYLGALTLAFWRLGHGMHVKQLDYVDAATIYMFSLAVILIGAGLISQIGTVDLLGMVVAQAYGIGYGEGLVMMLGFRIVWTGAIWALCLPIVAAMWREMPTESSKRKNREGSGDRGQEPSD